MKRGLLLSFAATLICATIFAQGIRFVEVDPSLNKVVIRNLGGATVDISTSYLCVFPTYTQISSLTLESGTLNMNPGDTAVITGISIDAAGGELGLYANNTDFADAANMSDYVQWLTGGGTRENVAVTKGIWGAGDFVTGTAPYQFSGSEMDTGVNFWSGVPAALKDVAIQNTKVAIFPNPFTNSFGLAFSSDQVDEIRVTDLTGNEVQVLRPASGHQHLTVHMEAAAPGVYFLSVVKDQRTISTKRLIKR